MTKTPRDFITIVSGLPRSGTSMLMQMLQAGGMPVLTDSVRRADADNPRGYFEFDRVKQIAQDASWLEDARGKAVKMVYLLLYDLPKHYDYRVILMKRNLDEVLASQAAMLRRQGKEGGRLDDAQLRAVYQRHLHELDTWLRAQPNITVLELQYADVLTDPRRTADEIDRSLGFGLDVDAMHAVPQFALYRQRR